MAIEPRKPKRTNRMSLSLRTSLSFVVGYFGIIASVLWTPAFFIGILFFMIGGHLAGSLKELTMWEDAQWKFVWTVAKKGEVSFLELHHLLAGVGDIGGPRSIAVKTDSGHVLTISRSLFDSIGRSGGIITFETRILDGVPKFQNVAGHEGLSQVDE